MINKLDYWKDLEQGKYMINKLGYWRALELGTHDKQAKLLDGLGRETQKYTIYKLVHLGVEN